MAVGQKSEIRQEETPANQGTAGSAGDVEMQASGSEDIWDEERLENALKALKEMHIQLRSLRTTIPRFVAPLSTKQSSPEALFRSFSASAMTANQEVNLFREMMTDQETKKILERAKESREKSKTGIESWKVTDHPDWLVKDT